MGSEKLKQTSPAAGQTVWVWGRGGDREGSDKGWGCRMQNTETRYRYRAQDTDVRASGASKGIADIDTNTCTYTQTQRRAHTHTGAHTQRLPQAPTCLPMHTPVTGP